MSAPAVQGRVSVAPTSEQQRRVRMRNIAIGVVLGVLVVLFYAVTLVKLAGGVL